MFWYVKDFEKNVLEKCFCGVFEEGI